MKEGLHSWQVTVKTTTEAVEAISNIILEERCGGVMIEDPKISYSKKKWIRLGLCGRRSIQ